MKKNWLTAALFAMWPVMGHSVVQTFTTADAPVAIADNTGALGTCQTVNVTGTGTLNDIDVSIAATHSWVGDLTFRVQPPSGGSLTLLNRPGRNGTGAGESDDLTSATPVLYNDEAAVSAETMGVGCTGVIGAGCPTTTYIPAPDPTDIPVGGVGTNLAQFDALANADGLWTLCAADSAAADTGTLTSWSLIVDFNAGGPPGVLSIAPTSVNFGTVAVGVTSTAQTVTLSNTGGSSLTVGTLDAPSGAFARSGGNCGAVPFAIAAGANCTVDYTFTPAASGAAQQILNVNAGAAGSGTITLNGAGGPPGALVISPTSVNLGTSAIGVTTAAQTVTLSNTGGSSLTVSTLDAAAAPFAVAGGTCGAVPFSIAAGANCTVNYTFTPTVAGAAQQILNVNAGSAGSGTITLNGTGGTPGVVGVLSATLDFGAQTTGATRQGVVTVTNTGGSALQVTSLSAVTAPFAQIAGGTCGAVPFSVAAGGSCTVLYAFTPTTTGTFTQPVTITSDAGTATVTLSGRGVVAIPLNALSGTTLWLLLGGFGVIGMLLARRRG